MTNVDVKGARTTTASGPTRPGTSRVLNAAPLGGRWSDAILGITWKEARRPVFKAAQGSDDGRRKVCVCVLCVCMHACVCMYVCLHKFVCMCVYTHMDQLGVSLNL